MYDQDTIGLVLEISPMLGRSRQAALENVSHRHSANAWLSDELQTTTQEGSNIYMISPR